MDGGHCGWRPGRAQFRGEIFETYRGRAYENVLGFAPFVDLISDALLEHRGSAHQALKRAEERHQLDVTPEAVYGKLRRIPISLSTGFLAATSVRLQGLLPEPRRETPKSLQEFALLAVGGKKIRNAAKRLKPVRKVKGSVLGGKALVAFDVRSGLVAAMNADPDGEVNDPPLVPGLLEQLRQRHRNRRWPMNWDVLYPSSRQTIKLTGRRSAMLISDAARPEVPCRTDC